MREPSTSHRRVSKSDEQQPGISAQLADRFRLREFGLDRR